MLARTALPAFCAGLLVVAIGCVSTQPVSPSSDPKTQQQAVKPEVPAKKFVDDWFKIYSDALSDLTATRGRWEVRNGERVWVEPEFGLSRLPRIYGHNVSTGTEFLGDREKLQKLMDEGAFYGQAMGFGAKTSVLTKENARLRFNQFSRPADTPYIDRREYEPLIKFARDSLDPLVKGEIPTMKYKEWDVQARLMRLNDKECLRCHVDNKLNDPVAVFLFATKPK
jgi:hypothetical protein